MTACSVIHDYPSALEFLFHRINYERTSQIPYLGGFKLDRMRELLRMLGNPHEQLPIVHVAGTKGKGSTASMMAAILAEAGYKTGLYTSPHLERLEERYVINGSQISPHELVQLVQTIEAVVQELDQTRIDESLRVPTFFEITTALAFLYFTRLKADIAVFEVGLGGRLDSTNVCHPAVCAITSISFDHTKQLGRTLAAIAREKAGIIKPGVPVVCGVLPEEPREVIHHIAWETAAPLIQRDADYFVDYLEQQSTAGTKTSINYREERAGISRSYANLTTNLRGEHQAANVGTALAAMGALADRGWKISEQAIRAGLMKVRCPARIELVRENPPVILDTAHNVASVEALCRELEQGFAPSSRVLVFATSRDKDARSMLLRLLPLFDQIVLTRYLNNPRARSVEELADMIAEIYRGFYDGPRPRRIHHTASPLEAWQLAQQLAGETALTCITGSFFLAAELRAVVTGKTA